MKKRVLAILLVLALVVGLLPAEALAAEPLVIAWAGREGHEVVPESEYVAGRTLTALFFDSPLGTDITGKGEVSSVYTSDSSIATASGPDSNGQFTLVLLSAGNVHVAVKMSDGTVYDAAITVTESGGGDEPGNDPGDDYTEPTQPGLYFREIGWGQEGPQHDANGRKYKTITMSVGNGSPYDFVVLDGDTWGDPCRWTRWGGRDPSRSLIRMRALSRSPRTELEKVKSGAKPTQTM